MIDNTNPSPGELTAVTVPGAAPDDTREAVSLALGILAILCPCFGWFTLLGLVLGIIGVVLGAKARRVSRTRLAEAGFWTSLTGLIFCALVLSGTAVLVIAFRALVHAFIKGW